MLINIPPDMDFTDLRLERRADGGLRYLPGPLFACCRANGLDVGMTLDMKTWRANGITEWYIAHRAVGGEPDAVVEQIVADIAAAQISDIPSLQLGGRRMH